MKPNKPYWEMNTRELAEATKEYEKESVDPPGRPMNAAERAAWKVTLKRIRRGRPTVGAGAQRVQVSMEKTLLSKVDRYAKAHNITRSELIARGVTLALAS